MTNLLSNPRPLSVLEDEFAGTLTNDVPNTIRRGELLIEIKEAVGHGNWRPWLRGKFALSQSTAQNYMNVAAFAEKFPTVGDLKVSPGVLYRLATASKKDRLTPDQVAAILDAAKDRWIDHREAIEILDGLRTEAEVTSVEDAPSVVPETEETVAPSADQNDLSDDVAAWIDRIDRAMSLLLPLAEVPPKELANLRQTLAISAEDLLRVGDFLKKLAADVYSATPALEAA
jgi:Protein of unknown function (DUF3102)